VRIRSYSAAVLATMAAFAVTWYLFPWLVPCVSTIFVVAVLLVTQHCGLGPGLLTAFLSSALSGYFFMEPLRSFQVDKPADWFQLASLITAVFIVHRLNTARQLAMKQSLLDYLDDNKAMFATLKRFGGE
jgi:K+-sensing histidine kinase KdpD